MTHLLLDTALCTNCRACVVACHFHHSRSFGSTLSSVSIAYDPESAAIDISIDHTCDQCAQEDSPLCARFCAPGAIRPAPAQAHRPVSA